MAGISHRREPRHGKPDTLVDKLVELVKRDWIAALILAVVGTLIAGYLSYRLFGGEEAEKAFDTERALEHLQAIEDANLDSPVDVEGDPFGGPLVMRLGVGGSWPTVERTRSG